MNAKATKEKRAAIYTRVSTSKQTTENQRIALEAVAAQRGWEIVKRYEDAGISGSKGREKRPGLDQMLKGAASAQFNVLMVWSIDRLGRSLSDLLKIAENLEDANADLFILQQDIDTTSKMGKLFYSICGSFGEFEKGMIVDRVNAGLARAVADGRVLGRPKLGAAVKDDAPQSQKDAAARGKEKEAAIKAALIGGGKGINKIAKEAGVGAGTVMRIKAEMQARNDALVAP